MYHTVVTHTVFMDPTKPNVYQIQPTQDPLRIFFPGVLCIIAYNEITPLFVFFVRRLRDEKKSTHIRSRSNNIKQLLAYTGQGKPNAAAEVLRTSCMVRKFDYVKGQKLKTEEAAEKEKTSLTSPTDTQHKYL